ncbi:MAG: MraY family glycosyltransferase [Planctomycetota bacterium]
MKSLLNSPHVGILILAWLAADLLIPLLIRASRRAGLLDRPGGHKGHRQPIPFLGGVGVFIAFTLAVCSTLRFESGEGTLPLTGMLLCGAIVLVLGIIDDMRPMSAFIKLAVLIAASLLLVAFGVHVDLFPPILFNLPNVLLTLLWIGGVTSAANSLDNTDGVLGGTAAIAGIFVFLIAWGSSPADAQPGLSYLAVALVGACLGFLRYNFPPARVYLGDNGAFFLGFLLAAMLVFGHYSHDPVKAALVPCLILSVPLMDITLVTLFRFRNGEVSSWEQAILYCGRDHIAHLLMELCLSKRSAALVIYGFGFLGGGTALLVHGVESRWIYLPVTCLYLGILAGCGAILGRVHFHKAREQRGTEKRIHRGSPDPAGIPGAESPRTDYSGSAQEAGSAEEAVRSTVGGGSEH